MGVAGSGKTTLGRALALELGAAFLDADDLHPDANITRMSSGQPLTDDMRWPWLDDCGAAMAERPLVVLACSALKRSYRNRLRHAVPNMRLVYPNVTKELIRERLGKRASHFMPARLIESQFETLEPPDLDENAVLIPVKLPTQVAARQVASVLLAK